MRYNQSLYICTHLLSFMYAIVKIAGKQLKVENNQKLFVNRLENKEGSKVTFNDILMIENNGKTQIGDPVLNGAAVEVKVLKHLKDDKVIVFKKKRRKGYRVKNGHRQSLTEILVEKIIEKGAKKSSEKDVELKESKPAAKKPAAKKPAAKKPAAKKPAAKKPAAKKPAAIKTKKV